MFLKRQAGSRELQASTRRGGHTGAKTKPPYLPSNLSEVIFQSLIELACRFTIRKTIMCDFVQASLFEVISDFAAVDSVFWRENTENLTEEFQSPFSIALEVCQYFTDIEMTFGAEAACVQKDVAGDRHAHNRAPDVDVRKIE